MDLLVSHGQITTGRNLGNAVRTRLPVLEFSSGPKCKVFSRVQLKRRTFGETLVFMSQQSASLEFLIINTSREPTVEPKWSHGQATSNRFLWKTLLSKEANARLLMSAWLSEACFSEVSSVSLFGKTERRGECLTFVLLHSHAVSPLRSSLFPSHKI